MFHEEIHASSGYVVHAAGRLYLLVVDISDFHANLQATAAKVFGKSSSVIHEEISTIDSAEEFLVEVEIPRGTFILSIQTLNMAQG